MAGSYARDPELAPGLQQPLLTGAVTCDANNICTGDPETPVFSATAGKQARMHITNPHGTTRGSTFALHGHVWQRDPYICPGEARNSLTGACNMTSVGSRALGNNPIGFAQGGQESWNAVTHFDIVLPSAGGGNAIMGDYLARDRRSFGNAIGCVEHHAREVKQQASTAAVSGQPGAALASGRNAIQPLVAACFFPTPFARAARRKKAIEPALRFVAIHGQPGAQHVAPGADPECPARHSAGFEMMRGDIHEVL